MSCHCELLSKKHSVHDCLSSEPVAAAMAYGFGKATDWDTLLVFDLGGGTLDLSILESFEGIMEVRENRRVRSQIRL